MGEGERKSGGEGRIEIRKFSSAISVAVVGIWHHLVHHPNCGGLIRTTLIS